MRANIGISELIWICSSIVGLADSLITGMSGGILLFIQQCAIMMCTAKMNRLCKELFSKTKNNTN